MKQITTFTEDSKQSIYFVTEDGIQLHLTFVFRPRLQSWSLDIESDKFNLNGICLSNSPNILDKYNNILTFGIQVVTIDGVDPWRVEDLRTGYCSVSILNEEEKEMVSGYLNGQ